MPKKEKPSNRTKILVAIIGAIAVVVAAIINAYAPLIANSITPSPFPISPSDTPSPIETPSFQPTAFLNNLSGTWTGSGKDILNGVSYDTSATVTLSAPCVSGQVCGQVFIPTVNCSFTLTYLSENAGRLFFREGNYAGNCGIATLAYLELLPNGDLLFHSEGDFGIADVTMTRQN